MRQLTCAPPLKMLPIWVGNCSMRACSSYGWAHVGVIAGWCTTREKVKQFKKRRQQDAAPIFLSEKRRTSNQRRWKLYRSWASAIAREVARLQAVKSSSLTHLDSLQLLPNAWLVTLYNFLDQPVTIRSPTRWMYIHSSIFSQILCKTLKRRKSRIIDDARLIIQQAPP